MEHLNGVGRVVGTEGEDALGPLRRALGRVASLGEAVTSGVLENEERGLRDLAKRLGADGFGQGVDGKPAPGLGHGSP